MSENKVMIRFYLWVFAVFALLTYAVDLNSQFHFIVLNSPLVSNSFCFSILSGVLTGVVVALAVEIKQYFSRKRQARALLFGVASELYGLLAVQQAAIAYYIEHPSETISKNLCGDSSQQPINYHILQLKMADYNTFKKSDSINGALRILANQISFIEKTVRGFINIPIAYNKTELNAFKMNDYNSKVTSASTLMLSTLQKITEELEKCLSDIDAFCGAFEKLDNSRYSWNEIKESISEIEQQIRKNVHCYGED